MASLTPGTTPQVNFFLLSGRVGGPTAGRETVFNQACRRVASLCPFSMQHSIPVSGRQDSDYRPLNWGRIKRTARNWYQMDSPLAGLALTRGLCLRELLKEGLAVMR